MARLISQSLKAVVAHAGTGRRKSALEKYSLVNYVACCVRNSIYLPMRDECMGVMIGQVGRVHLIAQERVSLCAREDRSAVKI